MKIYEVIRKLPVDKLAEVVMCPKEIDISIGNQPGNVGCVYAHTKDGKRIKNCNKCCRKYLNKVFDSKGE